MLLYVRATIECDSEGCGRIFHCDLPIVRNTYSVPVNKVTELLHEALDDSPASAVAEEAKTKYLCPTCSATEHGVPVETPAAGLTPGQLAPRPKRNVTQVVRGTDNVTQVVRGTDESK